MADNTDTLVAHIMVGCPKTTGSSWIPVIGFCKPCEFCQGFVVDPNDNHITGVRCEYRKRVGQV